MSDDVNKSNKPVNGKAPKHLREAFESRDYNVSYENLSGKEDVAKLNEKLEALEAARSNQAPGSPQYKAAVENIGYVESDLADVESMYAQRYNEQLASTVATYSKNRNINERTTTMAGQQRFFRQARTSPDKYAPTEVLEQRIQGGVERAASLGTELAGRTRGLGPDEIPETLHQKASQMQSIQEEVALNKRLLKVQRREGLSTEKRQYGAGETLSRAGSVLSQDALSKEVSSRRWDLDSETEKLSKSFEKLQEALERFEAASENATDAQGNLTDEYKKASDELNDAQTGLERQRSLVTEVQRQYGRGKDGLSGFGDVLGAARGVVGSGYAIEIEDKMTEMRLKGAMGQTAVDQYNRVEGAVVGNDAASLIREVQGQSFIKNFSDSIRGKSTRRAGMNAALDTADAGLDAGLGYMVGGPAGAFMNGAEGGAKAARSLTSLARGIPQTISAVDAKGAAEQIFGTLSAIPTKGIQSVMNQGMMAGQATVGGGSAALGTEQTLLDTWWLKNQAAGAGLSPAMASQLTQQSINSVGMSEAPTSVALRAGRMEQRGLVSQQDYIGLAGGLADVGASTGNLEDIMKNAVAAGMDNAKNINQMVEATMQMSAGLTNLGSSAQGSGNLLAGSVQALRASGTNRNQASQAALSAIEFQKGLSSNLDVSIGSVYEMSEFAKLDPNSSITERMALGKMSQADYQAVIEGGMPEAERRGIAGLYERMGESGIRSAAGIKRGRSVYDLGGHIFDPGNLSKNINSAREGNWGNMSQTMQGLGFISGGVDMRGFASAGQDAEMGDLPGERNNYVVAQRKRSAKFEARQLDYGGGDDINQTLSAISVALTALSENLKPEDAEKNVEEAAETMRTTGSIAEAGDTFKDAAGTFSGAVKAFNEKLNRVDLSEVKSKLNLKESGANQTPMRKHRQ